MKLANLRNGEALCASIGGMLLSCAVFYDPWGENRKGSIYELGLLATDQRLRGQIHLGQTVLRGVEKLLAARDAGQITLSSTASAEGFYKKMGYKKQGQNSFVKSL